MILQYSATRRKKEKLYIELILKTHNSQPPNIHGKERRGLLESRIEARLRRGVIRLGGICDKWVCPGSAGKPDRIVILPGNRIYFVETKQATGKARRLQETQHRRLRRLGCQVYVTPGAEAVDAFLAVVEKEQQDLKGGDANDLQAP